MNQNIDWTLETKSRLIWDLISNIETLQVDKNVTGNREQAYNLCLIAQDQCLRLITEIDAYKHQGLGFDPHTYLTDVPEWKHMPRGFVEKFADKYGTLPPPENTDLFAQENFKEDLEGYPDPEMTEMTETTETTEDEQMEPTDD